MWRYADIRPQLLRAGELTPIERAERRVLVLCNPGLGLESMQATPSIYVGLQLILPGEKAPNHRHTPSAIRFVIEGNGGYTIVEGEKLPMEKGDLILTPSLLWHDHGHEGEGPVVWLDALDLPLVYGLEASYAIEAPPQQVTRPAGHSTRRYRQGGVIPYAALGAQRAQYPLLRFPWKDVRRALDTLSAVTPSDERVHVAYVNPETGRECLPTLGFSALLLRPGEEIAHATAIGVGRAARGRRWAACCRSTTQRTASARPTQWRFPPTPRADCQWIRGASARALHGRRCAVQRCARLLRGFRAQRCVIAAMYTMRRLPSVRRGIRWHAMPTS